MLLVKGQMVKISELTDATELVVNIILDHAELNLARFFCLGLDEKKSLVDDASMVFYLNPEAPGGSVRQLGPFDGDSDAYVIDLAAIPPKVSHLAFLVFFDGEATLDDLSRGFLRMALLGRELARFSFANADLGRGNGLLLGYLSLHLGEWRLQAEAKAYAKYQDMFHEHGALRAFYKTFPPVGRPAPSFVVMPSPDDGLEDEDASFEDDAWADGEEPRLGEDRFPGDMALEFDRINWDDLLTGLPFIPDKKKIIH